MTSASEKMCGRPPTPPVAWFHQIHASGGVSGSTMVALFVMLVVLFVAVSSGFHHLFYVDKYQKKTYEKVIGVTLCPTLAWHVISCLDGSIKIR